MHIFKKKLRNCLMEIKNITLRISFWKIRYLSISKYEIRSLLVHECAVRQIRTFRGKYQITQ